VKTKETIIKLSHNIFGAQKVVEHPLLSETAKIGPKNGCGVRAEVPWLVNSNEDIFEF
jgi:hypothetical protein